MVFIRHNRATFAVYCILIKILWSLVNWSLDSRETVNSRHFNLNHKVEAIVGADKLFRMVCSFFVWNLETPSRWKILLFSTISSECVIGLDGILHTFVPFQFSICVLFFFRTPSSFTLIIFRMLIVLYTPQLEDKNFLKTEEINILFNNFH